MRLKDGVSLRSLHPAMGMVIPLLEEVYLKVDCSVVITSAYRDDDSLHSRGQAIDVRLPSWWSKTKKGFLADSLVAASLAWFLGTEFDVVLEEDHIHIEYDPR